MKKIIIVVLLIALSFTSVIVYDSTMQKADVTIYSSMEDFRNEKLNAMLKAEFPKLKIVLQYMSTGNSASKIKTEKTKV